MAFLSHEQFFGLKVEGDGDDIHPDETPDSQNDDISSEEGLTTRPGMTKQNITALGNPVWEVGFVEVNDKIVKLAVAGGTLQVVA